MAEETIDKIKVEIEASADRANKAIDDLIKDTEGLRSALKTDFDTKGLKSVAESFSGIQEKIKEFSTSDAFKRLSDGIKDFQTKMGVRVPTEQYEQLTENIRQSEAELEKLYQKQDRMEFQGISQDSASWKGLQYDIAVTSDRIADFRRDLELLERDGGDTERLYGFSEVLKEVGSLAGGAVKAGLNGCVTALKAVGSAAKSMASKAGTAFKALGKLAGEANIGRGFLSSLSSTAKNLGNVMQGLSKRLNTVTRLFTMMLLRRGISALFNELGTAIQHLAQRSDSFNAQLSSLMSACSQFSHQVAALAAPLLNIFGPALQTIINMLATATAYINQFLSALTGKSVFTSAKAVATDYAASLSDAAGAAKELENATVGIDELNIISPNDSSSGGGAGGSGADLEDCYEELAINQEILDLVQQIKDAWAEADFTNIGQMIGERLKTALDSIDWAPIQESAEKIGKSIATLINGFVETAGLAESVGYTIGQGLNTAVILAHSFLDNTHWDSIGEFIGNGLNSIVSTVNWSLLGQTLAEYFSAGLEVMSSAVLTFDWAALGENFGTGFNSFVDTMKECYENIEWEEMGQKIADGLNTTISTVDWGNLGELIGTWVNSYILRFKGLFAEFDWAGAGLALANALNGLISTINWADLGIMVSDFFKGVLDFFRVAIEETDWFALGENVKTFLVNIDWAGIAESLFGAIGAAFGGLFGFLSGLLDEAFTAVSEYFQGYVDQATEDGTSWVSGLLNGIIDALANIVSWIDEHVFTPFVDAFKNAFGIHSPSTVMEEMGGYLIEGLLNGISGAWGTIVDFLAPSLDDLKDLFTGAWDKIKETTSGAWDTIKNTFSGAWENVKSGTSTAWSAITGFFSNSFGTVKSDTSSSWSEIENSFSGSLKTVSSNTTSSWSTIKSTFSSAWSTIKTQTTSSWSSIRSTFSSSWSAVRTEVTTSWQAIQKTFTEAWTEIMQEAEDSWTSIKEEFTESWKAINTEALESLEELLKAFTDSMTEILNAITDGWSNIEETFQSGVESICEIIESEDWNGIGEQIVNGIWAGIEDGWPALEARVRELAEELYEETCEELEIESPSKLFKRVGAYVVAGLNEGLDENADSSVDSVKDWVGKISNIQADVGVNLNVAESFKNYTPNLDTGFTTDTMLRTVQETVNANGMVSATLESGGGIKEAMIEALSEAIQSSALLGSIEDSAKRQADKSETTKVYVGSREIAKTVKKQQIANGYSFSAAT